MPFAPAETLSIDEFAVVLETLEHLLKHLPAQLPSPDDAQSRYRSFLSFSLDPDMLEKTGCEVATLFSLEMATTTHLMPYLMLMMSLKVMRRTATM
jgi:hypothetical protein